MIGAKGHLIREISEECGGVQIRFPSENMQSDKVYIRGAKEDVERAKKRLLEVASDRVSDNLVMAFNLLICLQVYSLD